MATVVESPTCLTVADLLEQLGGVPPERVRLRPLPGTATIDDVVTIRAHEKRLFELVNGVLVEKAAGFAESVLAGALVSLLREFVVPKNLGVVAGESCMLRLFEQEVRIPNVAFFAWVRFPNEMIPQDLVPQLVPDLAVEILRRGNTHAEIARNRSEYFGAGTRLVWIVDPRKRTAEVWTTPDDCRTLDSTETLDGGDVLPGFSLPLATLFAELDRTGKSP